MPKSPHYKAYSAITFCKNTTEKDLYDLFGDSVGVMDDRGNEIPNYFQKKYGRNGMNNK